MPDRVSIKTINVNIQMVRGELEARHLNPLCGYNIAEGYFFTMYGPIPQIDVLAALNGDSDMFQLWMMGFTLDLSRN